MKLIIDNIEIHDVEILSLDNDNVRVTLMQDTGKPHFEGCAVVDLNWNSLDNTITNPVLYGAWDEDDNAVALENWEELKSRLESILVHDNFFLECATI
jgi:hypothetical protein